MESHASCQHNSLSIHDADEFIVQPLRREGIFATLPALGRLHVPESDWAVSRASSHTNASRKRDSTSANRAVPWRRLGSSAVAASGFGRRSQANWGDIFAM